jgi:hypothetical protein
VHIGTPVPFEAGAALAQLTTKLEESVRRLQSEV